MNISIDLDGTFKEHEPFFNEFAKAMQFTGHRVGIITGERESKRPEILQALGFVPDFLHLWPQEEAISNGNLWKCERMDEEDVTLHFDDDAREMKRYTDRWIMKTLNSSDQNKF